MSASERRISARTAVVWEALERALEHPAAYHEQGGHYTAGGMGRRRVLIHSSGFAMSPYSDIKPAGEDTKDVARKLWHRSPGSAG